jgi:hypothetical protein
MALTCDLSPLVFAELYRMVLSDTALRARAADRLETADESIAWIEEAERKYRSWWEAQVAAAAGDIQSTYPAEVRDAQLATWLIAPFRNEETSVVFSAELYKSVNQIARTAFPSAGARLPGEFQVSVVAWTLGRVCGEIDMAIPVAPAEEPDDRHVAVAYDGLLKHVVALPEIAGPWPEMIGSAIIWRIAGLADGLRPQQPKPDLRASLGFLMKDLEPVLPSALHTSLSAGWHKFQEARNCFTHVAPRDGVGFADFAQNMRCTDEVREYLRAATYFVCNEVSTALVNDDELRGRDQMLVDRLEQFEWLL